MKILVAVKHVIDVELNIKVKDGRVDPEGMQYVMSAWDENAVEAAVVLKEEQNAETTVVSIGGEDATVTLRKAFAMGIDEGVHVLDAGLENCDSHVTAQVLKAVIDQGSYDLVILGRQSQDTDNGHTGGMLAEYADLPCVANAVEIQYLSDDKIKVTRQADIGKEVVEMGLPGIVTVNDSLNEPRLASLRGIMQAKKKSIQTLDLAGLGVESPQSMAQVLEFLPPEQRAAGQKFEGDAREITEKVVSLLAKEAKVI